MFLRIVVALHDICEFAFFYAFLPNAGDFLPLGGKPSSEPPQSFLCPITCEIMVDPVMDADGNTYERWAITRWLEKSQQSPITRMPIASRMLVPNRALKAIIDDWRKKNNVPVPSSRPRASTASVSLSNSGTSTGRPPRVHSGRSRTGFRVSTLNVVLVVGALLCYFFFFFFCMTILTVKSNIFICIMQDAAV